MRFYLGVYHPQDLREVSRVARIARSLGAGGVFIIGSHRESTWGYPTYETLHEARTHMPAFPWVALETSSSAVVVDSFTHPDEAVYLVGPQNGFIPPAVLADMAAVVKVQTEDPWPLPVPVAAGIVLYDRSLKLARVGL